MSFWASFWLTNIHFAVELFGTITFLLVVYVLFGVWKSTKKITIGLRALGFLLFPLYFALHSAGETVTFVHSFLPLLRFVALLIIALSFFIDSVQSPPPKIGEPVDKKPPPSSTKALFLLPSGVTLGLGVSGIVVLLATTIRIYQKYSKGLEKELKNLLAGFGFLFLSECFYFLTQFKEGSYITLAKLASDFGFFWAATHLLQLAAFVFFAIWAWGYLRFKLTSQIIGAFVATTLLGFITVTFVYTSLLFKSIEKSSLDNLEINSRTLNYAIERLKDESLAKTSLIASNQAIADALSAQDEKSLSVIAQEQLIASGVDFLVILDINGRVLARGEDPEAISESFSSKVVTEALEGGGVVDMVTREWVNAPQVIIEAASPVGEIGVVYTGRIIDSAFVDGLKEATGLDVAVFAGNVRSATTLKGLNATSRLIGTIEADENINNKVLTDGELYLGLSNVFQKEYLSAYGPFKNFQDETLGMFFVGYPSIVLFEAARKSLNITFYVASVLALLSFIPAYFLAKFIEKHQV